MGEIVWRVEFLGGIYITAELWFWDSVIKWVIISARLVCGVEVYIFLFINWTDLNKVMIILGII